MKIIPKETRPGMIQITKKQKIRYISLDESSVKFRDQIINFYHAKILITDIRLFIIGLNS